MRFRTLISVAVIALATPAHAEEPAKPSFGTVQFPISCTNVQARFNDAVAFLSNFAYPDTVKAFQAISQADPNCAMAYWGVAMSEMPNPLSPPFPPGNMDTGWQAIQKGKAAKTQTPREAEYLFAIEAFYRDYDKLDYHTRALRYEEAMQKLHEDYPDDVQATIFYALALNMAIDFGDRTYHNQLQAAGILNAVEKAHPDNPGVYHFLIHSYDYPPLATLGLTAARRYDKLAPASVHALHMPSHIYSMLGMWGIRSAPISPPRPCLKKRRAGKSSLPGRRTSSISWNVLICNWIRIGGPEKSSIWRRPRPRARSIL